MTTARIGGLPFWELRFDASGDPDPAAVTALLKGARACGVTDLVLLAHGWNNDRQLAGPAYEAFFGLLAVQARQAGPWADSIGLAGVHWPARRWPDEPVPDFAPAGAVPGPGPAPATLPGAVAVSAQPTPSGSPRPAGLDDATLGALRSTFPTGAPAIDRMAHLLLTRPTPARVDAFAAELRQFAVVIAGGFDDGESAAAQDDPASPPLPGMLHGEPAQVYGRFLDGLRRCGTPLGDAHGGGAAGLGDPLRGIWHGAKEALRQLTYWQMKNRAGVIGRAGLGPVLAQLPGAVPGVRIHLVGHSFGARLVSFAAAAAAPVRSVTLLQGALSRFAFAPTLPFAPGRSGALATMPAGVAGPVTACYSTNDSALGVFYPLASLAAGDDAAALPSLGRRWGALGFHGASAAGAPHATVAAAGRRDAYQFGHGRILNVDATGVVRRGGPPSGAHSDVLQPELTWLVLLGGGLV
ncbi:hypothetical protein [Micromonospora sp. LOL_023]|uniref:hypothetical protein n=1 Tax=Micromonospora sp. LOL_023 TaxID=3345418 RepID=UPI003A8939BF